MFVILRIIIFLFLITLLYKAIIFYFTKLGKDIIEFEVSSFHSLVLRASLLVLQFVHRFVSTEFVIVGFCRGGGGGGGH